MTYEYRVYYFHSYKYNHLLDSNSRETETGADFELNTFSEVLEALKVAQEYPIDIDVDCLVDGQFFATLRYVVGDEWCFLTPESGDTWTVEEYAWEMS